MSDFFSRIGRGIRDAVGDVGKFMGEMDIFGQVAMMFIPIPGIGSVAGLSSDALGSIGGMVTEQIAKLPGGQKIADGANWVLDKARDFSTKGENAYKNITGAVTDFFDVAGQYVKAKLGVGEEMTFGEAVSKYTEKVSTRYHELRDASKVGDVVETPEERAEREKVEGTGTTETKVEPGLEIETSESREGKVPTVTLESSLLAPTTEDVETETEVDQVIDETTREIEDSEDELEDGSEDKVGFIEKAFTESIGDVLETQIKSLILGDDDRRRSRHAPQRMPQFVAKSPYPTLPSRRTPDFVYQSNVPRSSNGMWGAGSTYQNDLARRLRYGTKVG